MIIDMFSQRLTRERMLRRKFFRHLLKIKLQLRDNLEGIDPLEQARVNHLEPAANLVPIGKIEKIIQNPK